jgi:hypothetical protein
MNKMKTLLLAGAAMVGFSAPAYATLQIAFSNGLGSTFSCSDQTACDEDGAPNALLLINTVVGNFRIEGSFAQSFLDGVDQLSASSLTITNTGTSAGTLEMVVGDTSFVPPAFILNESASATFNNAVGSGLSSLSFFVDPTNTQPAGPGLVIPGTEVFSVSGTPLTDPSSFAGTHSDSVDLLTPFSMTEVANIALAGGASITGFNLSMEANVPEPSTWAMLLAGFGFLAFFGIKRRKVERLATL